ncbi:hypothetical protein HK107_01645 [Parvularcula sp. ZS-1/3]|uniref:Uncharacterized protein n=1 Tax=Parvularcula mediterranea TaxID=2732508 RepID=A0A7Y3RKF7_9PROT|nr:hypothetical protein [Parvularcula mediterranea]
MPLTDEIIFGFAAAVMAGLIANALCLTAIRSQLALDPVSDRSNHKTPVPRLGGMAVVAGILAGGAVLFFAGTLSPQGAALILLAMAAGGIGLLDDFFGMSAQLKMLLLAAVAFAGAVFVGPITEFPVPLIGWVDLPMPLGILLAAFWLLSIINTVNFMDGLNGLVGTTAIVILAGASLMWSAASWPLLTVQVALLGFLFCNVFAGRIFLGDAGSLAIGTLIGAAPLLAGEGTRGFWIVPLVALPLIMDVAVTLVRRAARGERLSEAHREHFYQHLKASGWSHQATALAVVAAGLVAALVARLIWQVCVEMPSVYWLSALFIALLWAVIIGGMLMIKRSSQELEGTFR